MLKKVMRYLVHTVDRNNRSNRIVPANQKNLAMFNDAWKSKAIPQRQWEVVESNLERMEKEKQFPAEAKALIEIIKIAKLNHPSLLEVGCSSGYYSKIFSLAGLSVRYEGCDYSPHFIKLAQEKFPEARFYRCDATALDFSKNSYDIVLSGSCILHILNYEASIKEAARVAKKFVVFHKTPVIHLEPTTFTTKHAYGEQMFEIQFNEQELFTLFRKYHLVPVAVVTFGKMMIDGLDEPIFLKDYLCKKSP